MESAGAVPSPSAVGCGQHSVFVYGSLRENEILHVLLKRVPPYSPAVLHGYNRLRIKGRSYPAIIPAESKSVDGKVLLGITDAELDILDAFEDSDYERTAVEVSAADHQGKLIAHAYVWMHKNDPRLEGEWDFNEWREKHLMEFSEMTVRFAQRSSAGRLKIP